jgi:hypothetical protein
MQAAGSRDGRVMADQEQPRRVALPTLSPAVHVTCGQAHTCFATGAGCALPAILRVSHPNHSGLELAACHA